MKCKDILVCCSLVVGLPSETFASPSPPASSEQAVTFSKDVAPIIFQHCSICHHPGQAGPFNLLTYSDLKKRAKLISKVVEKRYMPPWLPERSSFPFANDRSLTPEQVQTIRRWVDQGAVEGSPSDLPMIPKWTDGWRLGKPDLVLNLPEPYALAAEGKDVYRNFVIPIPVSERKYVRGVEFLPGNWTVVHHAFIAVDSTRYSRIRAAKENPPGFDGMFLPDTAVMPGGHFLGWQPGKVPSMAPDGLAWILEKNTDLVLQLHLHPSGKPEKVQPTLAFYFTEQAPTNSAFRLNLNALQIDIPAGATNYSVEDRYTLPVDLNILGVLPHAHYLGKRLEGLALMGDGTKKQLILINDWDFNWQGDYRYASPIFLPKGTTLVMNWSFDNSTNNVRNPNQRPQRVRHGSQTTNEMAELWFQVLPVNSSERGVFEKDFYEHLANLAIDYNESLVAEDPNNAEAHTKAGRAEVFFGEVSKGVDHFQQAIKADRNFDKAWYELGFVYLRQNRLEDARVAFENVVRVNHEDYEAEGSLGVIYLRNRDLNRAEDHFKAALRINPDDKIAAKYLKQISQAKTPERQK